MVEVEGIERRTDLDKTQRWKGTVDETWNTVVIGLFYANSGWLLNSLLCNLYLCGDLLRVFSCALSLRR